MLFANGDVQNLSQVYPVVLYTPALFYQYGLKGQVDPYFSFLSSPLFKEIRRDLVFPYRVTTPFPFIEEGDVCLKQRERSTLYALPEDVAMKYFEFLESVVVVAPDGAHVARMAVVDLLLRDPFLVAVSSPEEVENVPVRRICTIAVETRDARYSFVPSTDRVKWQVVKGVSALTSICQTAGEFGVIVTLLDKLAQMFFSDVPSDEDEQPLLPVARGQIFPANLEGQEIAKLVNV